MAYTGAQMDAAVAALCAAIHGLKPEVARAWATAEQGVAYNILGVTYTDATGQHLFRFASWTQGAQAAAHLIATGPYAGIRSALATGDAAQQASAIIASPWNHPYYSSGAGAAALRALAAGPTALHTFHIAPGARVTHYALTTGGCLDDTQTIGPWHEGSSAPCGPVMRYQGCAAGRADVAKITAGPLAGRYALVNPPATSVT